MYTEICAELGEAIAAASNPQAIQLQLILGLLPGNFSADSYCVCQKSITTTEVCANFVLRCGTVPSWLLAQHRHFANYHDRPGAFSCQQTTDASVFDGAVTRI
jgi:hypothetical protein